MNIGDTLFLLFFKEIGSLRSFQQALPSYRLSLCDHAFKLLLGREPRCKNVIDFCVCLIEMEQIAGLVASGSLIMVAASMMKAAADNTNADEAQPNAALAAEGFNAGYAAASKKSDALLLAASFGCPASPYTALQNALAKTAFPLTMYATENYADIDLRSLLKSSTSFVAERKLQTALLEEGLVMIPGEAFGLEEPGFFRISVPKLSSDDVATIVQKLNSVSKKFNPAAKRTAERVEAAPASPPVTASKVTKKAVVEEQDDAESVAESVPESLTGRESTRKRRKA